MDVYYAKLHVFPIYHHYTKKRGSLTCRPFHTSKLLALPIVVERAAQNPRRCVYNYPSIPTTAYTCKSVCMRVQRDAYKNIPWASTVAMFMTTIETLREFRSVKNKACRKRFPIYSDPRVPPNRCVCTAWRGYFPPLRSSCGHVRTYLAGDGDSESQLQMYKIFLKAR